MLRYKPMPIARSCADGWLDAVQVLYESGPANTMILHVEDPVNHSEVDHKIIAEVDGLLREHNSYPVSTVANTIFPQALYKPGHRDLLYERYKLSFPKMKRITRDWGRYFDRMIRWDRSDGKEQNQLDQLIINLNKYGPEGEGENHWHNMYEMTLFHPEKDADKPLGRQCLSFIEIKPEQTDAGGVLHMTAVYRSHYYVAKTLGNLIGLGRLLKFIAHETGCQPGSLTVHSTYAEIDTGTTNVKKCSKAWGKGKVKDLILRCDKIRQTQSNEVQTTVAGKIPA